MNKKVDTVYSIALETTGFNRDECNKAKGHQIVSIGIVAADAGTFAVKDKMYFTVKWNGKSDWSSEAESIHHISKYEGDYTEEEALALIADFIVRNSGIEPIVFLGHNFNSFALWFISDLFDKYNFKDLVISARSLDTFTLGKTLFNLDTQSDLFKFLKIDRPRRSIDKSIAYLKLFRISKKCWDKIYET
jgi:hypothetical protein